MLFVPTAEQLYQTKLPNLLVAGCSYVWNNSEEHACAWPYYIQDIMGFSQVFDCSQSGGGPDNVFNSVVNEVSINTKISKDNTMIIIMWPELCRTDVVATTDVTKDYHHMSLYHFNEKFSNLSIYNSGDGKTLVGSLSKLYKRIVSTDAQEYQSLIKIIALSGFLKSEGYRHLFLSWKKIDRDALIEHGISEEMINVALDKISTLIELYDYTESTNQRIPGDGHPTPDAHISWAREFLAPYLQLHFSDVISSKRAESIA